MALLMLDIGGSALQVALLFAFRWTPMLLFALVSGMVADRANRRLVMIVARGVAVAVTAVLLVSGGQRPGAARTSLHRVAAAGMALRAGISFAPLLHLRACRRAAGGRGDVAGGLSAPLSGGCWAPWPPGCWLGRRALPWPSPRCWRLYSLAFLFVLLVRTRLPARASGRLQPLGYCQDGVRLRLPESGGAGRADGNHHLQRPGVQRGVAVSGGGDGAPGGWAGADGGTDFGAVLRHARARRWSSDWCPTCATTGGFSVSGWRYSWRR